MICTIIAAVFLFIAGIGTGVRIASEDDTGKEGGEACAYIFLTLAVIFFLIGLP